MTAQARFPHERLQGKSMDQMQEMLWQEGVNWNDTPGGFKRGRCIVREAVVQEAEFEDKRTGEVCTAAVERRIWRSVIPPVFTQERDWLRTQVPRRSG